MGDVANELKGLLHLPAEDQAAKLRALVCSRALSVGRVLSESPGTLWEPVQTALGALALSSSGEGVAGLAREVAVARLRKWLLGRLEEGLDREGFALEVSSSDPGVVEASWQVEGTPERDKLLADLGACVEWLEGAGRAPTRRGPSVPGVRLRQDVLPPGFDLGPAPGTARHVAPLLAFLAARGQEHEAKFPIVMDVPGVLSRGGLVHARVTLLQQGLGEPGVHVAPWSVFDLSQETQRELSALLAKQDPGASFVLELEPSPTTWERTLSTLEIEGGSLGFAVVAAAEASASGRSLADFVASAALEVARVPGGEETLVLRQVTGLDVKFGADGALADWLGAAPPYGGSARTIVVARESWDEIERVLGAERANPPVNLGPDGAWLFPRHGADPVPFSSLVDQLVLRDPGVEAALQRLAGDAGVEPRSAGTPEPAEKFAGAEALYRAALATELASSAGREPPRIIPLPFDEDPAAWGRALASGLARAALEDPRAPVPVLLDGLEVLDHSRSARALLREAFQATGSQEARAQVLANRLHLEGGYHFLVFLPRSRQQSPLAGKQEPGEELQKAASRLGGRGRHPITFLVPDFHQAIAVARDRTEIDRLAALHPAPWRLTFLGAHMEHAAYSTEGLLALGPKGLDRTLTVDAYFEEGEKVAGEWGPEKAPTERTRPYFIVERVFPYTPPTAERKEETWTDFQGESHGKPLAEVLRGARKPVLLTGCSGSGKTLVARHFSWGLLQDGNRSREEGEPALFVEIDGSQLRGLKTSREVEKGTTPRLDTYLVRAVRNAVHQRQDWMARVDPAGLEEQIRSWIEHSPPILFILDLNRSDTSDALALLEDVLRSSWTRQHKFLIIYRTQSALLDRDQIWKQLDPVKGATLGCEMRDLELGAAKHYFRAARRAWAEAKNIPVDPQGEEGALDDLVRDHKDFLGIPLLLHFAASVGSRFGELPTLAALYQQVFEAQLGREIDEEQHALSLATQRDVKSLTCLVSLEFAARATLVRRRRLGTRARGGPEEGDLREQEQGLFLGKPDEASDVPWTHDDLLASALSLGGDWEAHFQRTLSEYRGSLSEPRALERERLLLEHSVFTRRGEGLHYTHDSFGYYFSAYLLRHPAGLQLPLAARLDPRQEEARRFLGRLAVILKEDPVFWYLRAEFLGGLLPVDALHWLVFRGILADPGLEQAAAYASTEDWEQLALIFLASRLARGLGTRERAGSEAANALRRFHQVAWPAPTKVHAPVEELVQNWSRLVPEGSALDRKIFVLADTAPADSRVEGGSPRVEPLVAARTWEEALGQVEGSEAYRRARPAKPWRELLARVCGEDNLVPLGLDPRSRLLELADLRTGRVPRRSAQSGALLVEEGGAQIFVLLPGGERDLGSPPGESGRWDDENLHSAGLAPFLMGKHPLTQGQWRRALASLPAGKEASRWEGLAAALAVPEGERHHLEEAARSLREVIPWHTGSELLPMECVSWYQASLLLELLGYRLPAEAEWEYACRGTDGEQLAIPSGAPLGAQAWFLGNSVCRPHPVGEKAPNGFGLHDLLGNVWEWCLDWYEEEYGAWRGRGEPGFCALSGSSDRVLRGGSYWYLAWDCRSAGRFGFAPFSGYVGFGFRPSRPLL